jgi:hypothetical protein
MPEALTFLLLADSDVRLFKMHDGIGMMGGIGQDHVPAYDRSLSHHYPNDAETPLQVESL